MPLAKEFLAEVQGLLQDPAKWFSIPEIRKHRPELFATEYIKKATGERFSVEHLPDAVYRDLQHWAADLLEHKLRTYEMKIARVLAENAATPSPEDDVLLVDMLTRYIKSAVDQIDDEISRFVGKGNYPVVYTASGPWSKLDETGKRMASELSVTVRLAGELSRLELVEAGIEPPSGIGFSQTRIEQFYSQYSKIPHPFDSGKILELAPDNLSRAIRLVLYVVFQTVQEPRLSGFESKFVSAFLRYLTCPRHLSASAVEHVAGLFEPFLKKIAFLLTCGMRRMIQYGAMDWTG